MTDDELIQRARNRLAYANIHDQGQLILANDVVEELLRAVDERDALRAEIELLRAACKLSENTQTLMRMTDRVAELERERDEYWQVANNHIDANEKLHVELGALRERVAELERGEYICRKCLHAFAHPLPSGCKCKPEEWGGDKPNAICKSYIADIYGWCANCDHDKACHEK